MYERGIHTTQADIWLHFFPKEYRAYWYWVRHMLAHIKATKPPEAAFSSKNGKPTGKGYRIKKRLGFVYRLEIPRRMVEAFEWEKRTDREVGFDGETVMDWFLASGGLNFGIYAPRPIRTRAEQYDIGDFELVPLERPKIEVKTENHVLPIMFVQTCEENHEPYLVRQDDGTVETRQTELPGLQ